MYLQKLNNLTSNFKLDFKAEHEQEDLQFKEIERSLLKLIDEGEEPFTYSAQIPCKL